MVEASRSPRQKHTTERLFVFATTLLVIGVGERVFGGTPPQGGQITTPEICSTYPIGTPGEGTSGIDCSLFPGMTPGGDQYQLGDCTPIAQGEVSCKLVTPTTRR